jgi:hypothetical protein
MRRVAALMMLVAAVMGGCGSDDDAEVTSDSTASSVTKESVPTTEADTTTADTTEPVTASAAATTEPVMLTETDATLGVTTPPVAAGERDPCGLLASVDLDGLLGEPAGTPVGETSDLGDTCTVEAMAAEESRGAIALSVSTGRAEDNFATQQDVLGVDAEINGLGDAAFHTGPYVVVRSGDTLFFIQVVRDAAVGFAVPDEDMEAAAQQILVNLDS